MFDYLNIETKITFVDRNDLDLAILEQLSSLDEQRGRSASPRHSASTHRGPLRLLAFVVAETGDGRRLTGLEG
jgi:hypothetical protein